MEKRLELRRLSEDPKANLYAINKVEKELNAFEQEFYRKAQQTEVDQRRLLAPEQIKKIKDMPMDTTHRGMRKKMNTGDIMKSIRQTHKMSLFKLLTASFCFMLCGGYGILLYAALTQATTGKLASSSTKLPRIVDVGAG